MKHTFLIFVFMFCAFVGCSQEVELVRIMTDGSTVITKYSVDTETLVIYDSADNGYKTKNIQGLEGFRKLNALEFQNLAFLENYDFLRDLKRCTQLYICTGPFFDFSILENVTDLEYIEFSGYISDLEVLKLKENGLDVSSLKNLNRIAIYPMNVKIDFDIEIKYFTKK